MHIKDSDMSTYQNKQITYSSVTSPNSSKSPTTAINSPYYNANKFSFSPTSDGHFSQNNSGSSTPSGGFMQRNNNFRKNFDNNQHQPRSNFYQSSQQNGVSLYIKANNVTEDILKSIFNANVSQAKIISIDVKIK